MHLQLQENVNFLNLNSTIFWSVRKQFACTSHLIACVFALYSILVCLYLFLDRTQTPPCIIISCYCDLKAQDKTAPQWEFAFCFLNIQELDTDLNTFVLRQVTWWSGLTCPARNGKLLECRECSDQNALCARISHFRFEYWSLVCQVLFCMQGLCWMLVVDSEWIQAWESGSMTDFKVKQSPFHHVY